MSRNPIALQTKKSEGLGTSRLKQWLVGLIILTAALRFPASGMAATNVDTGNQNGKFIGQLQINQGSILKGGEWWYDKVVIAASAALTVPAYAGNPNTGRVVLHANTIWIEGKVNAVGKGYAGHPGAGGQNGGSGGGGGSWDSGGDNGNKGSDGVWGSQGDGPLGGAGGYGAAGSGGGSGPHKGGGGSNGSGASGGSGSCLDAMDGGVDSASIDNICMGSAGGSGGGGAGGGGGGGGSGCALSGCGADGGDGGSGGAGGSGGSGGNGGGLVQLFANQYLMVNGEIDTCGLVGSSGVDGHGGGGGGGTHDHYKGTWASGDGGSGGRGGDGSNGGNGAGGGVWLYCPKPGGMILNGKVDARGGKLSASNTGVVRISYRGEEVPNTSSIYSLYVNTDKEFIGPQKPQLACPDDLAMLVPQITEFGAWYFRENSDGAVHVKISRTSTFDSDVAYLVSDSVSNSTVGKVNADFSDLNAFGYGNYYWMAWCVDGSQNCSEPSDVRTFSVAYNYPPTLLYPEPEAQIQSDFANLKAKYYANSTTNLAGTIHFQVASDEGFKNIVCDMAGQTPVASGNAVDNTATNLALGKYYWRARSQDKAGICSVYSEARQFAVLGFPTATPTATATPTVTPTITPTATVVVPQKFFKVVNSVINPVRGQGARIRWSQPQSGPVSITIYNLLGERVKVLADKEEYTANDYHEVVWQGMNGNSKIVGSGIYLVMIKAPGYSDRSKIAIIK